MRKREDTDIIYIEREPDRQQGQRHEGKKKGTERNRKACRGRIDRNIEGRSRERERERERERDRDRKMLKEIVE